VNHAPSHSQSNGRRLLVYLILSNFLLHFGYRMWEAMFNNFAVEHIGIGPGAIGWIQATRELPGLMGFLLGLAVLYLAEMRIMALCVILLGVGNILVGQSNTIPSLLLSTLVMSVGFHFFYTSSDSVVLMAVNRQDAPKRLGQLGSLGAVAALVATGMVYLLADRWGYRALFAVTGGLVAVGGFGLLPLGRTRSSLPPRRKIVLRRTYWLYYTLSFLMGSRRHIFTTFAIFLLVKEHGISVQTTATLFLINSLISTYALQAIGRLVGRLGERLVLSITFALLILVFLGYAFVQVLAVLFALFVVDNILFGCNLALVTYFQKIAKTPEEITGNVSVEQTINHVAAVLIPVIGGTIWQAFGSQATFLAGAGLVALSLVLTQFVRTPSSPEPSGVSFA